jgi:insertion element IS1 protein InsB
MAVAFVTSPLSGLLVLPPSLTSSTKEPQLQHVNELAIPHLEPREIRVEIQRVAEAEIDEMWGVVEQKSQPRGLWHAIDHRTGLVFASVLGTHQDEVFLQVNTLLAPLGIDQFYPDGADVYNRHRHPAQQTVGPIQRQKRARKHLTCRTRLQRVGRKTICFSNSVQLHDIVIGLFVNRDAFGMLV